jgi:polyadenylation factor subunit 2
MCECIYSFFPAPTSRVAQMWRPTLELIHVVNAHRESCRCVSFSPSDRKFVTASDDSTVALHDIVGGKERVMSGAHAI